MLAVRSVLAEGGRSIIGDHEHLSQRKTKIATQNDVKGAMA